MVAALGAAYFAVQRFHEFAVIRQSREGVVGRLVTDQLLALLLLRDIDSRADATCDFTGRRAQRAEMNAKMMDGVPILEKGRNAPLRAGVLRDGRGGRVLAFQVIVKRSAHQGARLHLQWT